MEKAIIFDFNITLPLSPSRLKEEQAAAVMNAARAEISVALNQIKREVTVDLDLEIMKKCMDKKLLVSCDRFGAFFFLSITGS
ncbi:hypothetical protein AMTRI_Chr05g67930 [Amborella trichopoda]